ncbi:hypothetical protein ABPG74_006468 [Tetrahymena malaccensis]
MDQEAEVIVSSSQASNFIIKVQINEFKFKYQVKDPQQKIQQLRHELIEHLKKLNYNLQDEAYSSYSLSDDQEFVLSEDDTVSGLISHNDLVKMIPKVQQEQDQKIQVEEEKEEDPKEAIVILYDISGSMGSTFYNEKGLPRIGAVNAFFSAFADKTLAMEYKHVVSLFWFDSIIEKKCEFIKDMNTFIKLVDDAAPRGGTRLYDSLVEGVNSLIEYKKKHPNTILRMIALTDGEDNESKYKPGEVAALILKNRIILDSFVVSQQSLQLKAITHASGGRCYCPATITDGLKLFEIETILSVRARDINFEEFYSKSIQQCDTDSFINLDRFQSLPFDTEGIQVNYDKQIQQPVADISNIIAKYSKIANNPTQPANSGASISQQGPSQAVLKRIVKELETIQKETDPNFKAKVFPAENDIMNWKVLLIGPEGTTYNYGVFMLYITFPVDYPFKPPRTRFITPIYHPNISSQGHMCLDILKDQWSPALTIQKSLNSFLSLMSDPNPNDALDSTIAAQYLDNINVFKQKCLDHIKQYANKSVDELMVDIMGASLDVKSEFYIKTHAELAEWINSNKAKF